MGIMVEGSEVSEEGWGILIVSAVSLIGRCLGEQWRQIFSKFVCSQSSYRCEEMP